MNDKLEFWVPGNPKPAGSKRGFFRPGMKHVAIVDACKESKPWKAQVSATVAQQLPPDFKLFEGPLAVRFVFQRERPKGHTKPNGDLNANGRRNPYPTTKPDVLKLSRAVEDACTGILYADDAQIVEESICKIWGKPGVRIEIGPVNLYEQTPLTL